MFINIKWGHVTCPLLWCQCCFHCIPQKCSLRRDWLDLHLDVGITKYLVCCKTSTFFAIKSCMYKNFVCTSTFVKDLQYNGETDNTDNSSREILSKQWTFYQCFSELAHFLNEKILCFWSAGHLSWGHYLLYGFPKCREGEVPPHLFYHPHVTKLGSVAKAIAS